MLNWYFSLPPEALYLVGVVALCVGWLLFLVLRLTAYYTYSKLIRECAFLVLLITGPLTGLSLLRGFGLLHEARFHSEVAAHFGVLGLALGLIAPLLLRPGLFRKLNAKRRASERAGA